MPKKVTFTQQLIGFAMTAPSETVDSVIEILQGIQANRVNAPVVSLPTAPVAGGGSNGKDPAKVAAGKKAAAARAANKAAGSTGNGGDEGDKDPERVARGKKAAATRAAKKAAKEAALNAVEQRTIAPEVAVAPEVNPVPEVAEQEPVENFRIPRPNFGPGGELIPEGV